MAVLPVVQTVDMPPTNTVPEANQQVDGPSNHTNKESSVKKVSFKIIVEDVDSEKDCDKDSDKDIGNEGEVLEETINQTLQGLDMALIDSDDTDLVSEECDEIEHIPCSQMKRRNPYESKQALESVNDNNKNVQDDAEVSEMSGTSMIEER